MAKIFPKKLAVKITITKKITTGVIMNPEIFNLFAIAADLFPVSPSKHLIKTPYLRFNN
jgi:hypothetical protein